MTTVTVADGSESVSVTRFADCDSEGATLVVGEQSHRLAWTDLQGHASFPAPATQITEETITTPLGTYDCLLYTVERNNDTHRFWFARALPGMPIKRETVAGDLVVSTATVISNIT